MENGEMVLVRGGAGLTKDDNWEEAMKGCRYVLQVASPTHSHAPKDENEMIRPAVECKHTPVRLFNGAQFIGFQAGF